MAHSPSPAAHDGAGVKAVVNQQFSQVAAAYSSSPIHASGPDLAPMLQVAQLSGHETMLDAGCGPGHTALFFAPHVTRVIAADLSEAMLDQGRTLAAARAVTNVEFRRADVEDLPFPDGAFDLVTTRYSAHHWPHPVAALREFRRVLRPGGQLLLGDVVSFDDPTLDTHFQAVELLRDPSHVRDHTLGEWLMLLETAGFRAEVAHTWEIHIEFASWIQRMATPAPSAAMIQTILAHAPTEVRAALRVEPDSSFTMQAALLRGVTRRT